jgi:ABC-type sugar transport system permease subunit
MKSAPPADVRRNEARLGWALALPALGIVVVVAVMPIVWTVWESLHLHDLRMPWLGRPFVGVANYVEALTDPRFRNALAHTGVFVSATLAIEIAIGMILATALNRVSRGRGLVRTAVLLPWAIPTVVGALIWRFMFESPTGLVSALATRAGLMPPTWFADPVAAWIPLVLADAWKTTPFVALLLLAALQNIDPALYEAAAMDGAGPFRQFVHVTLPLLRPALLVTVLFRGLDAFRVFDVVYVMTGGGPGTATEPVAVYTFNATLQNLRFGFGAALSVIVFALAFCGALSAIRLFGTDILRERPA